MAAFGRAGDLTAALGVYQGELCPGLWCVSLLLPRRKFFPSDLEQRFSPRCSEKKKRLKRPLRE